MGHRSLERYLAIRRNRWRYDCSCAGFSDALHGVAGDARRMPASEKPAHYRKADYAVRDPGRKLISPAVSPFRGFGWVSGRLSGEISGRCDRGSGALRAPGGCLSGRRCRRLAHARTVSSNGRGKEICPCCDENRPALGRSPGGDEPSFDLRALDIRG